MHCQLCDSFSCFSDESQLETQDKTMSISELESTPKKKKKKKQTEEPVLSAR